MKKLFLVSVMLTAALALQAQLKVAPKLDKGTTKVYVTRTTTTAPGQDDILKEALGIILSNGAVGRDDLIKEGNVQLLAEGVRAFGSPQAFDGELASLSSFFMKAI